ncbi:hypothetical protein CYMTET_19179 [Cymbomonas tetramitiformis]|uniref:CAAX prenyl protease 2/Lysostaphin resistance protein A-like domain-containing protein n=1 Tax=Cymbomonas tetramitiformis TaxID=36881 RepID=A0AAE0G6R6_9CHLO|nr:hypothetical protein CYMTET_19179 [Cymbomonas tetramitiformis]
MSRDRFAGSSRAIAAQDSTGHVGRAKGFLGVGGDAGRAASMPFPLEVGAAEAGHVALAVGAAGVVTLARVTLLARWPEFKEATDISNRQVLTPLQGVDLLQVSAFPALGEELLFRGTLLPAVGADWRGVTVAGIVFGALHISGGRNPAFAVWSGSVGILYGALAVVTNDLYAPILAHTIANLASATIWQAENLLKENS